MTPMAGRTRPAAADSSSIARIRFSSVRSAMRPGIQPSNSSVATRAERGDEPQCQRGIGPPRGLGSIVTWSNRMGPCS